MTTVLHERAAAPADAADRPEALPASRRPSRATTALPSEPTRDPAPLVRLGPDRAAMRATGVLDGPGVARLRAALADAAHRGAVHIDLDVSGVTHVDGQGARGLLGQSYLLEGDGGGLRLHDASPQLRRALRFHGAGHLLHR